MKLDVVEPIAELAPHFIGRPARDARWVMKTTRERFPKQDAKSKYAASAIIINHVLIAANMPNAAS